MLRAGASIKFNKDVLDSENGILLSPVINLCGLILRADRPIPDVIKIFLESKSVVVKRVRYKGDLLVRLSGYYKIFKTDVERFISDHQNLLNQQNIGLEEVPPAINLQREISAKIVKVKEPLVFKHEGIKYSVPERGVIEGDTIDIQSSDICYNQSSMASRSDMSIKSPKIINQGITWGVLNNIGFFSESMACTITMRSQAGSHKNAITEARQVLTIEPDDSQNPSKEELRLDPTVKWFNNPHPDLPQPTEVTDTAELLASADEMLMRIRSGFGI